MRRKFTLFRIAFFSLLLIGTIAIEYSWLRLLYNGSLHAIAWPIIASVLLTLMIIAIFYYATMMTDNRRLLVTANPQVIKQMMLQLATPLSTLNLAADALKNERVMKDESQKKYYQKVINEESQRVNREVERFLKKMK